MDDIAILMKTAVTTDDYGNEVETETAKQVYCRPRSVTRAEFYDAAQAGLRPSVVLTLSNQADYDGEDVAEWRGRKFRVLRTYWADDSDEIELTLEERVDVITPDDPDDPPGSDSSGGRES